MDGGAAGQFGRQLVRAPTAAPLQTAQHTHPGGQVHLIIKVQDQKLLRVLRAVQPQPDLLRGSNQVAAASSLSSSSGLCKGLQQYAEMQGGPATA